MPTVPVKLPQRVSDWQSAVIAKGLAGDTIHGAKLASASQFEYEQFLLLRVLWVSHENRDLQKLLPWFGRWTTEADRLLKEYKSWDAYCRGFTAGDLEEGSFAVARYYQLEVGNTAKEADPTTYLTPIAHRTRARFLQETFDNMHLQTPSKSTGVSKLIDIEDMGSEDMILGTPIAETPSPFRPISPAPKELERILYPPSQDEQIVNCALIVFLNALTIHFKIASNWTLHRKAFTAVFDGASFEARTDGYLNHHGKAKVIVEVKPAKRSSKRELIQMQESAQMVAWIKSEDEELNNDNIKKTRLHVSQDRHEIFLTVAEYDGDYVKYLNDKHHHSDAPSFMTMHCFGPWDTREPGHMRMLGPILLGISLRADDEERAGE
ncbi:hypothetical protein BJX76DRAFT_320055 [Aspergillus varians]